LLIDWLRYGVFVKELKLNGLKVARALDVAALCVNALKKFEDMTVYHLSDMKLREGSDPFLKWKMVDWKNWFLLLDELDGLSKYEGRLEMWSILALLAMATLQI
jgi:hypothetical protein